MATRTVKIREEKRVGRNKRGNSEQLKPYQYKKGQSGNPSGRPKGTGTKKISEAYTAYLQQEIPDDDRLKLGLEPGTTWADAISIQIMRRSLGLVNSDGVCFTAVTELRETTEGKTPDKAEVSGKDGAPLTAPSIHVVFEDPEPTKEK